MNVISFSQTSKVPEGIQELNQRIKSQQDDKKRQYMDGVHPVKKAIGKTLSPSTQNQPGQASSSSRNHHQTPGEDDVTDDDDSTCVEQPEVIHGAVLDETRVLSVFGRFMVRKIEARRNIFEASTCLVEAVYKNNSVLAQMFTDALMPLCSSATSVDLDFEALLADAIKRGCSLSIISNVNQLWLKTQSKQDVKQLFTEYVRIMKASAVCRDDDNAERTVLYLCLALKLLDITKIDFRLMEAYSFIGKTAFTGLKKYVKSNQSAIDSQL